MRSVSLLVVVLVGCAEPKGVVGSPTPTASSAPSADPGPSPAPSAPSATASVAASAPPPAAPPAAKYPPKTGYLMREADGRCLYRPHLYYCPPDAACKPLPEPDVVICPRVLGGPPGKKVEKLPEVEGFLERHVDGSCWWANEAPAECVAGTPCPPMPVAKQVECHP
ncbi:MAG: hypothetical protein JNL79_15800 [Myxococcales bacterium]|nr:hypothetical protein [Myxococcales bacterium]